MVLEILTILPEIQQLKNQNQMKLIVLITLMLFSGTLFAQSLTIVGGGNYTELAYKQGSGGTAIEDTYKGKFGFNVGAYIDYVLTKNRSQELVVEGGLLFDSKGAVQEYAQSELSFTENTNLYYLDLPLFIKYRYRFRSLNKIYVGVGPYIGMGLFGNTNRTQTIGGESDSEKETIKWGSDSAEHDMKRLDYGATARVGFLAVSGLDISLSYDYGIPNIATMGDNIEMKNRVLRLSVGYNLSLVD